MEVVKLKIWSKYFFVEKTKKIIIIEVLKLNEKLNTTTLCNTLYAYIFLKTDNKISPDNQKNPPRGRHISRFLDMMAKRIEDQSKKHWIFDNF